MPVKRCWIRDGVKGKTLIIQLGWNKKVFAFGHQVQGQLLSMCFTPTIAKSQTQCRPVQVYSHDPLPRQRPMATFLLMPFLAILKGSC